MTVPAGWRRCSIDALSGGVKSNVAIGPFGSSLRVADYCTDGVPLIFVRHIRSGGGWDATHFVSQEKARQLSSHLALPGDVLVTKMGDPPGDVAVYTGTRPAIITADCIRLRVGPEMDAKFVALALQAPEPQAQMLAITSGVAQKKMSLGRFRSSVSIAAPELEEQRRIVEILEGHLTRLGAGGKDLVRAEQRTRVLELAFVGALLRDAKSVRVPLADLLDLSIGGVWGSAPGDDECDVDVLRVTELRARGAVDPTTSARRSVTSKVLASRQLEPGDLLLEKSGGGPKQPVGRVGLVGDLQGPSVCSNFMQLMRPRRSLVEPGFLHLYLNALHQSGGTSHMQRASTNIRNIKASEYLVLKVPVPDLETQRSALAASLASAAEVDRLRAALDTTQARSKALRRALLGAAFSGGLTSPAFSQSIKEMSGV